MCSSLAEDLQAFLDYYGGDLEMVRLAVTPEQIEEFDLPTAPPKATDNRSFDDTRTVQAEAIDPAVLAALVREATIQRMGLDIWNDVIAREERIRDELVEQLETIR